MNAPQPAASVSRDEVFAFVQSLAAEVSGGRIDLPSFPDIAVRVRRALADDNVTTEQVTRIVGAEPALAARLMQIANSAALNVNGRRVTDLRTAIARIGFNIVRSAAISFAVAQLKKTDSFKGLEKPLHEIWKRSALVAAMSFVVARRLTKVNPDTALLAGLLHAMGRLYILARAAKFPALFADTAAFREVERDWHANIAKAILENWEMAPEIIEAVHLHEDIEYSHEGETDLTDVLIVANLLVGYQEHPESIELNLQGVRPALRMRLDSAVYRGLLVDSGAEIEALRAALGSGS